MNHQDICYFFFVHVISILSCYAGVVCWKWTNILLGSFAIIYKFGNKF